MKVFFNITYKDGTTNRLPMRGITTWDKIQVLLEHYRSIPSVEQVIMDVE